jgi:uncharacterized phage-associated protein
MAYDARQIANWFVERANRDGRRLSIMSLLKLTYIAHGWHLETRQSALFNNRIEAWRYGPVIPDVYNAFRSQGVNVIAPISVAQPAMLGVDDQSFLEEIWKIYGSLDPFHLSELTHVAGGPWDLATKTGGYYAKIPDELILQHYQLKRAQSRAKNTHAG